MASILKNSTMKSVVSRSYAAQAAVAAKSATLSGANQLQVSEKNGVVIVSIETNAPVSSIAYLYKSGSRYETHDNLGISFGLRAFSGFATKSYSSLAVTRHFQQMGANFCCEAGKEHMLYSVSTLNDSLPLAAELLHECATEHKFKHWEVDRGTKKTVAHEQSARDSTSFLVDMLHKAAYRNQGLSNSLYMPDSRKGEFTTAELSQFMEDTHTTGRLAIVGLGVDHNYLEEVVRTKMHASGLGSGSSAGFEPTQYHGGLEIRQDNQDEFALVAVAGVGAKFGSPEAASLAVASAILWSSHGVNTLPHTGKHLNKFSSAISSVGSQGVAKIININYSDSGLFGFFLKDHVSKAGESTRALVDSIKSLKVKDVDVKQAIVKVKSDILMKTEDCDDQLESLGMQALHTRNCIPTNDFSALDAVTAASVQAAISKMLKSKPIMAAYGGIRNVPYLDQL